ncbi:hypothetical protein INP83_11335 [Mucilaginibacter sp. 21P]|uniref:hypothetical protein n=1 Tax=Mucilaginibacter sp. 21P TaxID=2778902 RepID=UPI001C58D9F7|nr:hypothetical protein [Mucilaginibacter sp. 21P]QXV63703.1 hypothetical protein INP83_11335 [Mucilaginibacter sp. 21P]
MKRNALFRDYTLLILTGIMCWSCKHGHVSRDRVDKNILLELVKQLADTKGSHAPEASRALLHDYAGRYEMVMVDSLFKPAACNLVQVRIVPDKDFSYIDIRLPTQLEGQLTYADFDHVFGAGTEPPRPKEPVGFSVMYSASKRADIRVAVNSHQPPEAVHPEIYQILIL